MKLQDNAQTQAQVVSHSHPTMKTFVTTGAVLFVITAIEFGIVYLKGMQALVIGVLAILSILKFVLVAGIFMHLKYDNKFLTGAFAVGFVLAALMVVALKFVNLA